MTEQVVQDISQRPLQALGDYVLIEKRVPPKKSAGGIILADAPGAEKRWNEGTVLSVGPLVTTVKAGDEVLFALFKGQSAGHYDEKRWFVKVDEVLALVKPS